MTTLLGSVMFAAITGGITWAWHGADAALASVIWGGIGHLAGSITWQQPINK